MYGYQPERKVRRGWLSTRPEGLSLQPHHAKVMSYCIGLRRVDWIYRVAVPSESNSRRLRGQELSVSHDTWDQTRETGMKDIACLLRSLIQQ